MKFTERIVIVVLLLTIVGGGVGFGFYVREVVRTEHQQKVADVALGKYQTALTAISTDVSPQEWRTLYPSTVTIVIGKATVEASVADSLSERITGLSNTPFLPETVVKLFVFGTAGTHSIWMKDMNYPLDILWLDQAGTIVHVEKQVAPESYPKSFSSPTPAWYVIEANAGFVSKYDISVGEKVVLPAQ
ncbi:MAG: hypothetical protein RL097_243 [Candidatus Parcubacteria bacterium]|jgi:uncharacterized protein